MARMECNKRCLFSESVAGFSAAIKLFSHHKLCELAECQWMPLSITIECISRRIDRQAFCNCLQTPPTGVNQDMRVLLDIPQPVGTLAPTRCNDIGVGGGVMRHNLKYCLAFLAAC